MTIPRWSIPLAAGPVLHLAITETCDVVLSMPGCAAVASPPMTAVEACQLGQALLDVSREAGAMRAKRAARTRKGA